MRWFRGGAPGPDGRTYMASALLGDKWFVHGGSGAKGVIFNDMWSFDFSSNLWTELTDLATKVGNEGHFAAAVKLSGPHADLGLSDFETLVSISLLLIGGKLKDVASQKGGIQRCDLIIPELDFNSASVKIDGQCVTPTAATFLLMAFRAECSRLREELSILTEKEKSSSKQYDEERHRYQDMLARYTDVKMQLDTVHENDQLLSGSSSSVLCAMCRQSKQTAQPSDDLENSLPAAKKEAKEGKSRQRELALKYKTLQSGPQFKDYGMQTRSDTINNKIIDAAQRLKPLNRQTSPVGLDRKVEVNSFELAPGVEYKMQCGNGVIRLENLDQK